jgi:hypothetical protein
VIRPVAGAVLLLITACSSEPTKPTVVYLPEIVGIVVELDTAGPGTRYELRDGRVVTSTGLRKPGSGNPDVGDLLVSGSQPAAWLHGLSALNPVPAPEPADCYWIVGTTWTSGMNIFVAVHDAALGDALISFAKAPDFRNFAAQDDDSDRLLGVFNCVNELGQVTEHRFGQ